MTLPKAVTKYEGPKIFLAAPKMVYFSNLPAVKKDTILGAARKVFGPSYFVKALIGGHSKTMWSNFCPILTTYLPIMDFCGHLVRYLPFVHVDIE